MGVSTDALLAFGVDLGDEYPESLLNEDDEGDFESWVLDHVGLARPTVSDYGHPDWVAYFAKRNEILETFPVDLELHCSYDYPMYILCVRGTRKRASRGSPESLDASALTVTPEQVAAFKAFCEEHDIDAGEPGWLLFSMWG